MKKIEEVFKSHLRERFDIGKWVNTKEWQILLNSIENKNTQMKNACLPDTFHSLLIT